MDENKNGQEQQNSEQKAKKPKKFNAKEIVTFVFLGVMVVCVVALFVLTYCFS